jgi:hypothetical protein
MASFDEELEALLSGGDDDDSTGQPPANPTPAQADGDTPEFEMTVGTPEVIRTQRSQAPDMVIEESISVPAEEGGWTAALRDAGRGIMDLVSGGNSTGNKFLEPVPLASANTALAGALHGPITGAVKSAGNLERDLNSTEVINSTIAPYRDWESDARAHDPELFDQTDLVTSLISPVNKLGALTKGTSGAISALANVGAQAGLAAADTTLREYGDTGHVENAGKDALMGGGLAVLPGVVGGMASAVHANRHTPKGQKNYANARLRSAGIDPAQLRGATPQEQAQVLADVEELAAQGGSGYSGAASVQDMNIRAHDAAAKAKAEKDAAIAALAGRDARVDNQAIANNMRANKKTGSAEARKHNALIDRVADEYEPVMELDAVDAPMPPPPAAPPVPVRPPPLPTRTGLAASAFENPQAAPSRGAMAPEATMEIAPQDMTPVRPSARYRPEQEAMPPGPSVPAPDAQASPSPAASPISADAKRAAYAPRSKFAREYYALHPEQDPLTSNPSAGYKPQPPAADPVAALADAPYYYHTTVAENVPGILRDGLQPRAARSAPAAFEPYGGTSSADQPNTLWLSDEAGKDAWVGNIAEERMVANGNSTDPARLVTFRTRAGGGEYDPRLQEYRINGGISPGDLEMSPEYTVPWDSMSRARVPQDGWSKLPAAAPAANPRGWERNEMFDGPSSTPAQQATTPPVGPPPLPPSDPVGALAAQGMPEEQFVDAVPMGYEHPRYISADEFNVEKPLVGRKVADKAVPTPEDDVRAERYAALMDAGRQGFAETDPALAAQWDAANRREGRMLDIEQLGQQAADKPPTPLIRSLGGLGAGAAVGGSLLAAGSDNPYLTTTGTALGFLGGRWAQPRAHALRAQWLSPQTNTAASRLEGLGRKPIGQLTSSFLDYTREPMPTEQGDPSDPNGPRSALNPGTFLGRDTTRAMEADPEPFLPWADDYAKAATDDDRAAVTERLYRTDVEFARDVFPRIAREMA